MWLGESLGCVTESGYLFYMAKSVRFFLSQAIVEEKTSVGEIWAGKEARDVYE